MRSLNQLRIDGWNVLKWQLYYRPYNWYHIRGVKNKREALGLTVSFIYDFPIEWRDWKRFYLPPDSISKSDLILDVGARDGDTLLFFAQLGYTNFRLIEPNPQFFDLLKLNAKEIQRVYGVNVEMRNKVFELSDLDGAAFVKFDCEGCEHDFDFDKLNIHWVAEIHEKQKSKQGIYSSHVRSIGYARGPAR